MLWQPVGARCSYNHVCPCLPGHSPHQKLHNACLESKMALLWCIILHCSQHGEWYRCSGSQWEQDAAIIMFVLACLAIAHTKNCIMHAWRAKWLCYGVSSCIAHSMGNGIDALAASGSKMQP